MNAADTVAMAWGNLARRKTRSLLTMAGVVVGVASLVLMVSLGLGLQRQVVRLFDTDESLRTLTVRRMSSDSGSKKASPFGFGLDGQMLPMTDKDVDELRAIPGVASARPELNIFVVISIDGKKSGGLYPVEGMDADEEARYAKHLVAGSMWTNRTERVCVVPTTLLDFRFHMTPQEAIGRKVTFTGFVQQENAGAEDDASVIVGVLDAEAFGIKGPKLLMPMEQAHVLRERKAANPFLPSKRGSYLSAEVRLSDPRQSEAVAKRMRNSGFSTFSAAELLKQINIVFLVLEGFMACVGAIGLVVSLFGIANTMAMAVLERTREIGIMKALGARNGDIGRLFLAEASAIGLLGGLAGLAAGSLIGTLLNLIARPALNLPADVSLFHVSLWLGAGSVVFSVFVSVVAGWVPARRASRMEPVAAVRYE